MGNERVRGVFRGMFGRSRGKKKIYGFSNTLEALYLPYLSRLIKVAPPLRYHQKKSGCGKLPESKPIIPADLRPPIECQQRFFYSSIPVMCDVSPTDPP